MHPLLFYSLQNYKLEQLNKTLLINKRQLFQNQHYFNIQFLCFIYFLLCKYQTRQPADKRPSLHLLQLDQETWFCRTQVEIPLIHLSQIPYPSLFHLTPPYFNPARPISALSNLVHPIPAQTSLILHIPAYLSMFTIIQPIPAYSSLIQHIPAFFILLHHIIAYSRIFRHIQEYSNLFQYVLAFSSLFCCCLFQLFQPILGYSSKNEPFPIYYSKFQSSPASCLIQLQLIPAFFILFQPNPAYISLFHASSVLFQPLSAYVQLTQGYSSLSQPIQAQVLPSFANFS